MSEETKVQQVQEDLNDQMLVRRDKLAEYEDMEEKMEDDLK